MSNMHRSSTISVPVHFNSLALVLTITDTVIIYKDLQVHIAVQNLRSPLRNITLDTVNPSSTCSRPRFVLHLTPIALLNLPVLLLQLSVIATKRSFCRRITREDSIEEFDSSDPEFSAMVGKIGTHMTGIEVELEGRQILRNVFEVGLALDS
jgi:hypothetical protein